MAVTTAKRKYISMRRRPQPAIRGIDPNRNYNAKQSALAVNCSVFSIFRARDNGYLKYYTVGRIKLHSGQHLRDWLEAGGKTGHGRTNEDDERESTTTNLETRVRRDDQTTNDKAGSSPKDSPA